MPRFIMFKCPATCKNKNKNEFNSALLLGEDSLNRLVLCEGCNKEFETPTPPIIKKNPVYPQFNHSLGCVISSEAHGDALAKKRGWTKGDMAAKKWWKEPKFAKSFGKDRKVKKN